MRKKERVIRGIKISILLLLLFCIFLLVMNRNAVLGFATDSINSISSKFYVSFDRFLGDVPVTEEEVEEPIEGINLEEDDTFTYQDIAAYQAGISDLFAIIGDKDYYYDHFSDVQDYYEGIQTKLSGDYLEDILNERKDSIFTTIFENIYKNEYMYYQKANLFGIGKTTNHTFLDVEIVAIGDSEHFFTQQVQLTLDSYDRIQDVKMLKEWTEVENTTTPLTKASILYSSQKDFLYRWNEIIDGLTNAKVYEDYRTGETSDVTYRMNTLIETVNQNRDPSLDPEILRQLFISGKGTFENYGCVKYEIQDIDMTALTVYEMKFSDQSYLVTYNRMTNMIESITVKA